MTLRPPGARSNTQMGERHPAAVPGFSVAWAALHGVAHLAGSAAARRLDAKAPACLGGGAGEAAGNVDRGVLVRVAVAVGHAAVRAYRERVAPDRSLERDSVQVRGAICVSALERD